MTPRPSRAPLRSESAGNARLQRVIDAFLIFFSHYVSHLLYPSISQLLAAIGVTTQSTYVQQDWTTHDTLASVTAIVAFQVMAEANGLYRSWQGIPARREVVATLGSWGFSIPVLLFMA